MKNLLLSLFILLITPIEVFAGKPPATTTSSTQSSIELAKHLSSIGAIKYSVYWCRHCHEQNQLFGKQAVKELNNVECSPNGDNNQTELCREKGITNVPAWEINGNIESGIKTLKQLSDLSDYKGSRDF